MGAWPCGVCVPMCTALVHERRPPFDIPGSLTMHSQAEPGTIVKIILR